MAGIGGPTRLTGLSGTLDTDALVKKLMQSEKIPLDNIQKKKQLLVWKREDYKTMNTTLLSLRSAADALRMESNFQKTKAVSSNSTILEISTSSASAGTSTVEVKKLASGAIITGGPATGKLTDKVSVSGTVTITGSKGSADITITQDSSSIETIVKDINAQSAKTGVKASFDSVNGNLYLSSSETGDNAKASVVDTNGAMQAIFKLNALTSTGSNAEISVNGSAQTIKSSSNSIEVNGVKINLRGVGTATIGVESERSGTIDKIKDFVSKYNELIDTFSKATSAKRNRDYEPLTTEQREAMDEKQIETWETKARQGMLYNDSLLKSAQTTLRNVLNMPVELGSGKEDQLKLLSQIGITVMSDYRENGKLKINDEKLQDAINNRFDEVKQLFTKTSDIKADTPDKANQRRKELGFGDRIYEELSATIAKFAAKTGSGSVTAMDESALGKELKELGKSENAWKNRLIDIENRYYKRFTAMEQALQKLNSQGSWIASQMGR